MCWIGNESSISHLNDIRCSLQSSTDEEFDKIILQYIAQVTELFLFHSTLFLSSFDDYKYTYADMKSVNHISITWNDNTAASALCPIRVVTQFEPMLPY